MSKAPEGFTTAAVRKEDLEHVLDGPVTITPEAEAIIRHYGAERDYLLWRLNRNYRNEDPGVPDYVGVRKTGQWEEATK